jgi:hypothetical protein
LVPFPLAISFARAGHLARDAQARYRVHEQRHHAPIDRERRAGRSQFVQPYSAGPKYRVPRRVVQPRPDIKLIAPPVLRRAALSARGRYGFGY